jgi:hypothetical protein
MPDWPGRALVNARPRYPGAGSTPPATFRSREADPAATVRPAPARALIQRRSLAGTSSSATRRPGRLGRQPGPGQASSRHWSWASRCLPYHASAMTLDQRRGPRARRLAAPRGQAVRRGRPDHDPERAHAGWRSARGALFRTHPQRPLPPGDRLRTTGLPCWDLRPRHAIGTAAAPGTGTSAAAGADGRRPDHDTAPHRAGHVSRAAGRHRRGVVATAIRRRAVPAVA